jgi:FlaA1/EpsC-like NDP-sugar epimerase
VLGASKRIAELLFVSAPQTSARRYRAVRLGNVLSSNGSVVPIFEGQIAAGKPLTVTDAEATRYVVTLTEAANVLLRAAVMDDDARLFVPSMRDPVRVIDIAYATMDHAGLPATQFLPIEVTGLRPGEKRHEDLLYRDESIETTSQATIVGVNGSCPSYSSLRRSLRALRASCNKRDIAGVCDRIQDIVPEFGPSQTLQALISGWKLPLNLRRLHVPGPTAVGIGYATGRYERVHQPIADR